MPVHSNPGQNASLRGSQTLSPIAENTPTTQNRPVASKVKCNALPSRTMKTNPINSRRAIADNNTLDPKVTLLFSFVRS